MMNHQRIERIVELSDEHVQSLCDELMDCVEGGASVGFMFPFTREFGKTLFVLDAVKDADAARLYERLDWVRVGDIPNYALMPNGSPCSTTCYYRNLIDSNTDSHVGARTC